MSQKTKDQSLNVIDGTLSVASGTYGHTINGNFDANAATTTGTFTLNFCPTRKLESSRFIEKENGNFIEMVYRETPNYNVTTGHLTLGYPQEYMVKEIYGVIDGKLQIVSTVKGVEKPGYFVPPTIDWEE